MTLDTTIDVSQRNPTTVSHTHYCVVGDVTVDNSAAIAPGVVLQALPGSRIIIGSRACLAGGVCIQSKAGVLTVSTGATLGANVLVVGHGKIGANACISPGSTLMNPQVGDNSLLPPNTLLSPASPTPTHHSQASDFQPPGYQSSPSNNGYSPTQNGNGFSSSQQSGQNGFSPNPISQDISTQPLPKNTFVEPGPVAAKPIQIPAIDVNGSAASYDPSNNGVQLNQPYNPNSNNGNNGNQSTASQSSALTVPSHDRVYGRDQVSELISTLFPNRNLSNGS